MHDLAAAQDILKAALDGVKDHDAKRVVSISVRIGKRMALEPERLEVLVQALAEGTVAEGVELEAEIVEGASLIVDSVEIE
jgi:Zn finger protein HypA/HybF involved in hydrogenase expression